MSPRIGWVILGPALWLAGSAVAAQEACGTPEGAGPRIEAAPPVVVRTEGATACVCGVFPDRAALEGLRIAGRPVEASADEFGRVATIRLPPDLPPGRYEVTGAPEAGYGPEDRAEARLIQINHKVCEPLPFGPWRRIHVMIGGTEEPVKLQVRNETPGLVILGAGAVQVVTTSGGTRNQAILNAKVTGVPGRWLLHAGLATPECPCAAGGPEGLPPGRAAALERCLTAAVAEIEAWFDGRAEELAARAVRGGLTAGEVIALTDELEERLLRVLATPELAALRAWVEDELARERAVWAGAPAGPVPAAARPTSGYVLAALSGPNGPPPILRSQAEASQSFGAFFHRVKAFFGDLRSVSNDLVVELCVRSAPSGAVAWVQPKRYSEGRRAAQATATEFLNLSRGIYVGEAEGDAGRSAFEVDLVRRYAAYVECTLGSSPCVTPLRPAGFVCREDAGR